MNGTTEDEARKTDKSIRVDLTGAQVTVIAGAMFGDTTVKEVAPQGAQDILDRLRGRGWKVVRA